MFEKVRSLYESGLTQAEVGKELGTTQKVIWSLFRRNGYKSRVAKKRNQHGEMNASWRGDTASYAALHKRVEGMRGKPDTCVMCETGGRCHWANVTGEYSNPYDYIRLCVSCHSRFDNKILNTKGGGINESL